MGVLVDSAPAETMWRRSGSALPWVDTVDGSKKVDIGNRWAKRSRRPALLRWSHRIEAWPPMLWIGLQVAALWPVWLWAVRRMSDGSDDALGLLALGVLAAGAVSGRLACHWMARWPWLLASATTTAACTALLGVLPPLALALLAAIAVACAWAAFRAPATPLLPVLGLLWLALPLLASMQFYLGYPLRWWTARCSAWLLQLAGLAAEPNGAGLLLNGQWVMVDAPCSGVQLAWFGYCSACAVALWTRLPDAYFLRRLPMVGLTVLAGNILRNTLLVAKEGGVWPMPVWAHDAIGLAALALVCASVVRLMMPIAA